MAQLHVFNFISLNGFFKDEHDDTSWHQHGHEEESDFAADNLRTGNGILVFGRRTYEMMASYWPSKQALQDNKQVAEGMNKAEKIVFSTTLKKADWSNTRLIQKDIFKEMENLKKGNKDLTILGSGSIVSQFAEAGLIDEYQFMVDPIALSGGTSVFDGIKDNLNLKLKSSRVFKSGAVLLVYQPA